MKDIPNNESVIVIRKSLVDGKTENTKIMLEKLSPE